MHALGFVVSFGGLVMINAIGSFSSASDSSSDNSSDSTYNYVCIAIGVVCAIACITFTVTTQCLIGGFRRKQNMQQIGNHNNANLSMQPTNMNGSNMNSRPMF